MKKNTLQFKELSKLWISISMTVQDFLKIKQFKNQITILSVLFFISVGSEPVQAQWSSTNYASGNINTVFCNGSDVLAGTNGGNGVSYTPDNGANWGAANTGMIQYPDVRAFASDPSYIYAGSTDGVYRSTNTGTYNWTKVLDNVSCFALLINSAGIFAGTMGGGVYFSSDNGTTWTQVNTGLTMLYVYALAYNGTYLFAGTYHNGTTPGQGVFRSSDNGSTWTQVSNGLTNSTVMSLATEGGFLFAGTDGGGIFRTGDNGDNWTNVAGGVVHTLKVVCGSDLYAGLLSGGGISHSTDYGNTWTSISNGLPNTGGYTVMSISANSTKIFAGTLGGGVAISDLNCTAQQSAACISWDLLSSQAVTSTTGNISGQPEMIGAGTSAPFMSVFGYNNGQKLWVGTTGWIPFPTNIPAEDPLRYLEFNASPTPGNDLTVNSLSFNYGDFPLTTDFRILSFLVYYSTDNWSTRTLASTSALVYLNTAMNVFNVTGLSVHVANGQTFSMRIYPYPILHGIVITPTFAIHNNVTICGTTQTSTTASICGKKFNDLNGNGNMDSGEPGIPGWVIQLTYNQVSGPVTLTQTTDADGSYCFYNLQPGTTYVLSEVMQSGWSQTLPGTPFTYSLTPLAGQNYTLFFGNKLDSVPATICGKKFNDLNGNGNMDSGETGLQGWGIQLTYNPGSGPVTLTQTTDSDGSYCFNNLQPGLTYVLSEVMKSGWSQTLPGTPFTYTVTALPGQNYTLFFGNKQDSIPATICGKKFNDLNGNGNMDSGESGLQGWVIQLTYNPGTGPVTITQTTDANGSYCFNNLRPGLTYVLSEVMQSGWSQTLPGTPFTYTVTASPGQNYTLFFGNKQDSIPATICGKKFNDLNGNGNMDSGEPGLPGWVIQLTYNPGSGPVTLTQTTDADGSYCFNNLLPGISYTVSEVSQSGWIQTLPGSPFTYSVTALSGQNYTLFFGNMFNSCVNAWSPLTSGTNGEVWALAVIGTDLYVGGAFTTAGGNVSNHIAKWDGSAWSPLLSTNTGIDGLNGTVTALAVIGTDLYAGGWFTTAGGIPALNIAKWDGSNWTALGSGISAAGAINALAAMGNDLYATTYILDPALGGPGNIIAKWDGSNWSNLSTMDDYVSSLLVDGSNLYAGGQFTMAGTVPSSGAVSANHIAKWDGTNWSPLGVGTDYWIGGTGLEMLAGKLYVGGRFTTAGGNPANFIANWDGTNWSSFGSGSNNGMNNEVEGLTVMGGDLYASGSFTTAEGVSANSIAKWDGTVWTPLGSGMNDGVWRMASIGTDLYAGGIFTTAGNLSANHIAKYSCTLPTGINELNMNQQNQLNQNQPNPFNSTTLIKYYVPKTGLVKLSVYDIFGKEIKTLVNGVRGAGSYENSFDGSQLTSGVYFYTLTIEGSTQSRKMILMK